MFELSQNSLAKLDGIEPDLQSVAKLAITLTSVDFAIIYGLRTEAEEAAMVAKGASQTMHSRHLPDKNGLAAAIDVAAFMDGQIAWEPASLYESIWEAFKAAGAQLGIPIEWGGSWTTLKDYGHMQLPWATYP